MPHVIRHRSVDRLFHWVLALCVLILLATGLLPAFGVRFDWVPIHWITGTVFTLLVLAHAVRSLFFKRPGVMGVSGLDLSGHKPGKYSLAQKLMHHAVALLAVGAVVTGVLMMVRIDTPFWDRNPYWLDAATWGAVYVVHGLAALAFVSVIMLHIYFSLRPEKKMYLRAMIKGWLSEDEYHALHDPDRWRARREEP